MKKIILFVLLSMLVASSATARNVLLFGDITEHAALRLIGELKSADLEDDAMIDLYVDSPGGSVLYSLIVAEFMQTIVHPIRVTVMGKAMSGAVIIVAAGTKGQRYAFKSSQFLVHKAYIPAGMNPDMNSDALQKELDRFLELDALLFTALHNYLQCSKSVLIKQIQAAEVFDSKRALKLGVIDHIIGGN